MYNNPYMNAYNPQVSIDRINQQMQELEQMKQRLQQPQPTAQSQMTPNINQTFQLAPTSNNNIKYANNIDDVNKEFVVVETPFFTKDFSQMWLKNPKGEVKIYELNEIISKDDKDILISSLQMQVEELRKEINKNAKSINTNVDESNSSKESTDVSVSRTSKKK